MQVDRDIFDTQSLSSTRSTSSPMSIFDRTNGHTAKKSSLKRPRDNASLVSPINARKKAKQKPHIYSPPTSNDSFEADEPADTVHVEKSAAKAEEGPTKNKKHKRSVDPVQQSTQMVFADNPTMIAELEPPRKKQKKTYASKGKPRAEIRSRSLQSEESRIHNKSLVFRDPNDRTGFATTIARRGPQKSTSAKPETEVEIDTADPPNDVSYSDAYESESEVDSMDGKDTPSTSYQCTKCRHRFPNQALLDRHLADSDTHKRTCICRTCNKVFDSRPALAAHQNQSGHGKEHGKQGVTGRFTSAEVKQLTKYRDQFCAEHGITPVEFNDLMTASCRRVKGDQDWVYRFIEKDEFLERYYSILPNRNKRSMQRYRERHFQNVEPATRAWTSEDDDELVALVEELGHRWVQIGQRLTRTQDAVQQRWRNKLQYRGKVQTGEWTTEETQELRNVVDRFRLKLGHAEDGSNDKELPWSQISNVLQNTRTAQQCAGKWALMQGKRERKYSKKPTKTQQSVINDSSSGNRSTNQSEVNTKHSHRGVRRHEKSKKYIQDSDAEAETDSTSEEDLENSPVNGDESEEVESEVIQNNHVPKGQTEISQLSRNPLARKTPKKGQSLSQVFQNTQANTSALSSSEKRDVHAEISPSSRPSPEIAMRLRPLSSPVTDPALLREDRRNRSQTKKHGVNKPRPGDGAEDEDDNDNEDGRVEYSQQDEEEADESFRKPEDEEEEESEEQSAFDIEKQPADVEEEESSDSEEVHVVKQNFVALMSDDSDEDDSDNNDETSDADEDDDDDSTDEDDETQGKIREDHEESEDSMVADARNDFMASVHETIQRNEIQKQQQQQQQQRRQNPAKTEESTSPEESDDELEDIEHG